MQCCWVLHNFSHLNWSFSVYMVHSRNWVTHLSTQYKTTLIQFYFLCEADVVETPWGPQWMSESTIFQVLLRRRVNYPEGVVPLDLIHESAAGMYRRSCSPPWRFISTHFVAPATKTFGRLCILALVLQKNTFWIFIFSFK